jgi:hypothetical protein
MSCIIVLSLDELSLLTSLEGSVIDWLFDFCLLPIDRTVVSHRFLRGEKSLFFFSNEPTKNLVLKKKLKKTVPKLARKPTGGRLKKNIKKTHKVTI